MKCSVCNENLKTLYFRDYKGDKETWIKVENELRCKTCKKTYNIYVAK